MRTTKWQREAIVEVGAERAPVPTWDIGVPCCPEDESCPNYDGKRCYLMGFRPHGTCVPTMQAMTRLWMVERAEAGKEGT